MRIFRNAVLASLAVLLCVLFLTASIPNVPTGTWQTWNVMTDARSGASAALLSDGRVLIAGGANTNGPIASADLFGTDGVFSAAATMNSPRSNHTATLLGDGRVLVTGGDTGSGVTNSAEVYDPAAGSWTLLGATMLDARAGHTASLLPDGRVLLAGGHNSGGALSSLEIFDPLNDAFTSAGSLTTPRMNHAAAMLGDGRVLVIGGTADGTNPLATVDIYDPVTGTVGVGPSLSTPRMSATATTTLEGKVAVIGGSNGSQDLASAEIFDPATGQFALNASSLANPRSGQRAFLLPNNNNVLIVGGTSGGQAVAASELFTPQVSPADGSWSYAVAPTGSNVTPRSGAVGSAMQQDGLLFAAGGNDASGNALASTELYAFPTVKTDQSDYPPGSTVTITGGRFKPGETVNITLVESPLIDTHGPYAVTADGNGNFTDSSFATDIHDVNVRFWLSAVGSQSGLVAQNTFTDANPSTLLITTPATKSATIVPGGASTSFQFTVNYGGNATLCTVNLAVSSTPAFPAAITRSFPSSVSGNSANPENGTLTFTASAAATPSTYSFTITGTPGTGCQGGSQPISDSGTLAVAGNATHLSVTGFPSPISAGTPGSFTVTALDANNNTAIGYAGTVTFSSSDPQATFSPTSYTFVAADNGTHTFTNGATLNTTGTQSITASANGVNAGSQTGITVNAGGASKLAFGQQPTDTAAGSAISPAVMVKIEDVNGNVVTSNNSTVSIAISSPGTFSGTSTTSVAAVNGVATFSNLVPTKVGTGFTLSATDGALTGTTSNSFNVTAGALDHFKVEQSGGGAIGTQTAGTPFNLRITAQDINNNTVTSFTSTVTLTSNGTLTGSPLASGTFTAGVLDPQGATITSAGAAVTITATGSGKTGVSNTFAVNGGALDHFKVEQSGGGAIGGQTAGTPFNLRITAQDINNNTVTSFTSTVTLTSSGTLTGSPLTSGTFTAGVLDPQSVTITSVGASVTITATGSAKTGTSNSFAVTAPDLTATKTNSVVSGTTGLGNSWTWSIRVSNIGNSAATFSANNQVILHDDLPSANVSYGTPTVGNLTGITNSNQIGCAITANVLNCIQSGNGNFVTLAANGSFTVSFTATPSAAGTFANPSSGGTCKVDPNNDVGESNTTNNSCADTVIVSAANTSITITSTIPATSGLVGQPVTVNFQVKNTSGTGVAPTGTVTVSDGTTADNCTAVLTAGALGVSTGSCNLTPSTTGAKNLTASYPASANFNASTSAGTPYTVNSHTTSTAVSCSPNPDNLNSATTCTATVTDSDAGTKTTPGGTVNFSSNGTGTFGNSASCALSSGSCSVTYTPTVFGTGTHRITGSYGGDTTHATSNGFFDLSVQNPTTTTMVASSSNPSTYGTPVTFTATVTSSAGTPAGSVIFYDGGSDCTTHGSALGTAVGLNASGVASLATSALSATTHTIVVCYTPTGIFQLSSGTVSQMVNAATLTITANDQTKGYGLTLSLGTTAFTTSGLVGTDSVTSVTLTSAGTSATAAAGSYAIVPSAAIGTGLGNYTIKYVNGTLSVTAAMLTITANDATKMFGQTVTFAGTEFTVGGTLFNGDSVASVTLTSAGAASGATVGSYPIMPSAAMGTGLGNYMIAYANGTLAVIQATPSLNWNTPAAITYGTALGAAQLNATPTTSGFFTYTPGPGTILSVGTGQTLTANFTPTDTVDYTSNSIAVQIDVLQATPTIFWQNPADITYGTALSSTQLNALALPPPSALTGWFKGEGNTDDSVAGNNGTIQGGVTAYATGFEGAGQAFNFNGSSGITVPNNPGYDLTASGFTASFWVQGSQTNFGPETILEKAPDGSPIWSFQVDSSNGHLEFDVDQGMNPSYQILSNVNVLDGNFHYIAGAWDGSSTLALYVDGLSQGTKNVPGFGSIARPAVASGLNIGFGLSSGAPGQYFTGVVDEVQIFGLGLPAGTYAYSPTAGTVLGTGQGQDLSVTFTPTDTTDLNSANANVKINVTKASQTITFGALANRTYGDPDFTVSATSDSGLAVSFAAAGNCTVSGGTVDITGAGSCTITASQAGDSNYKPAPDVPQTFTIAKADPIVTGTGGTFTYDGSPHAGSGTATGVKGENLTPVNVAYKDSIGNLLTSAPVNAGTYSVAARFAGNNNYNPKQSAAVPLIINKATPTVTVSFTASPITYDGNSHAATVVVTGVNSTVLTASDGAVAITYTPGGSSAPVNAGSYTASATFTASNTNYTDASSTVAASLTINKADPVVTATGGIFTYDGNPHAGSGTATGVQGENLTPVNVAYKDAANNLLTSAPVNAGTYSVAARYAGDNNYNQKQSAAVPLIINQAHLTVTADPQSRVYGDPNPTFTATIGGFVNGQMLGTSGVTGMANCTTTATATSPVSPPTYPLTCTVGTLTAVNYDFPAGNFIPGALTITARPITVTPSANQDKVYGYPDPALTYTITSGNLVTGDTLSGMLSRAAGENVGTYAITQGSLTAGPNYNLSVTAGVLFTITTRPITVTADAEAKVFGQIDPVPFTFKITSGSLATGDSFSGSLTRAAGEDVGFYPIGQGTLALSGNYNMAFVESTLTISPATTMTSIASSLSSSSYGQSVMFTATVTPQYSGIPTGAVAFYNAAPGATCSVLGSSSLIDGGMLVGGQVSISTATLPPGNPLTILACYAPATPPADFLASGGTFAQTVLPAPVISINPGSLSFGNQQAGTTSSPATVTVSNSGTAALVFGPGGISLSGTNANYFAVVAPSTGTDCRNAGAAGVAINGSCNLGIVFKPADTGAATAILNFTDNDRSQTTNSQQFVPISGASVSSVNSVASLFAYGIFATANGCGSLTLSGGSTVDSFDSSQGYNASHTTNGGNVGTNGNLTLSGGNVVVNGSASLPMTTTGNCSSKSPTGLSSSGGAQVTGGLTQLSQLVVYAAPVMPSPAPPTTNQNISGSCGTISGCTNNGTKNVILAPGQYANLNASGGTTMHVSKGTYNLNSLTLSGNSTLVVDSGPVVINIAGNSLSGGGTALDLSGGSMANTSGLPSNLQFYYGGSRSVKLSGGAGNFAVVYAPNSPITLSGGSHFFGSIIGSTITLGGGTAMHYDRSLPVIAGGSYIWFNSAAMNVQNLPTNATAKVFVTNASITFNGTTYPVPNAVITFSPTAASATTSWDSTNNRWQVLVPRSMVAGNSTVHTFLDGFVFQVPGSGLPNGIQNATSSAAFATDTPGVTFQWQWAAAVYTQFSTTYGSLGVNPVDNSDPAGTPENFKSYLTTGGSGAGATNYTGFYVGTAGVVPTMAPASISPSSLNFGPVAVNATSNSITAVLSNNQSGPLSITSISKTGSNAADFTETDDCPISPATLAGGGGTCTLTITFKPSATGTRKAKFAVNDNANNTPQTIYVSGTGQ